MALHPRLRAPLRGCMEADGWGRGAEADMIQAMFFWQGSDQDHHQGTPHSASHLCSTLCRLM